MIRIWQAVFCVGMILTTQAWGEKTSLGGSTLKNAGFEQWVDGKPVGWTVGQGMAFADEQKKMSGRRSLRLQVDPHDEIKHYAHSQISSDPVVLEPDSSYKLGLWIAQAKTVGAIRITVHASDGSVVGSYSSGWSREWPWLYFDVPFRTKGSRQ